MNETLSLSITNRVTGQADAEKLDQALVRIGNSAEKASQQSDKFAQKQEENAGHVAAAASALIGLGQALVSSASAYAKHQAAGDGLVDTYRGLRIGAAGYEAAVTRSVAPLLFTGTTLAIGVLVEESVRLTNSTGILIEEQAILATQTKLTHEEIQRFALQANLSGRETSFFTGAVKDLNANLESDRSRTALAEMGVTATDSFNRIRPGVTLLGAVADKFGGIEDPARKAELAMRIFGADGTRYLPILNDQLNDNIEKFNDFGAVIGADARPKILALHADIDRLSNAFKGDADTVRIWGTALKNSFTEDVADAYAVLKPFVDDFAKFSNDIDDGIAKFVKVRSGKADTLTPEELRGATADRDRFLLLKPATDALEANTAAIIKNRKASKEAIEAEKDASGERLRLLQRKIEADNQNIAAQKDPTNKFGVPAKPPLPIDERLLLDSRFGSEAQNFNGFKNRLATIKAGEDAEKEARKAAERQTQALDAADKENRQIALRAAEQGKSDVEKIELERQASIAKLHTDVGPGADRDQRELGRDKSFGKLLAKAAKDEADGLIVIRAQFQNDVNKKTGDRNINLTKFILGFDPKEASERLTADRQILDVQFDELRKGVDSRASLANRIDVLKAQPGGEFAAGERSAERDRQAANERFVLAVAQAKTLEGVDQQRVAIARAESDLRLSTANLLEEREVRILEFQKQRLDKLREGAGSVFDALTSRGATGVGDFVLGQLKVVERTIFQNAAVELGKDFHVALPGQGTSQNPNLLGRLLANTPIGLDPLKDVTALNTTATIDNNAALAQVNAALAKISLSGSGGGGGAVSPDIAALIAKSKLFGGVSTSGVSTFTGGFDSETGDPGGDGLVAEGGAIARTNAATAQTLSSLAKNIGIAGAAAGVGIGVFSGVNQGGIRGAGTATASAAGGAAALIPLLGLSAATGPLAPILAGVALAIPLITSLFGDPKAKRDVGITKELNDARFTEPTPLSLDFNQSGNFVDRDARGQIRTSDFTNFPVNVRQAARYNGDTGPLDVPGAQGDPFGNAPATPGNGFRDIHVNIQAVDTKSILDRHADIAEAVRFAVSNGAGDSLMSEVRQQTRTQ